jgi:DNA repair protein RecO (recombination protein O)
VPNIETEGLVLRTYNLSDADRIVVILTERQGLVRGVANGAKRLKSKFSSSLEFFSRIHLNYFQKEDRELVTLRSTELVESVFGRLADPEFFEAFAEIADLLIKFTPPNEPNQRLYDMTGFCLSAIKDDNEAIRAVRVYFEIWLLKLGGFLPDWSRCGKCGAEIDIDGDTGLSLDFQILCSDCGSAVRQVHQDVRYLFQQAQRKSPISFAGLSKDSAKALDHLGNLIKSISDAVLERSPIGAYDTEPRTG